MKSFAEAKQNEKILQSKVPRESIHIYENNACADAPDLLIYTIGFIHTFLE